MELTVHSVMVRRKQEQLYYKANQEPELKFTTLCSLFSKCQLLPAQIEDAERVFAQDLSFRFTR